MTYYNLNDYYNESASPSYHFLLPLGYVDDKAIYEGDSSWLCCLLEDGLETEYDDIPF
jgi:hypothetical protein